MTVESPARFVSDGSVRGASRGPTPSTRRVALTMRLDLPESLVEAAEYVASTGTRNGSRHRLHATSSDAVSRPRN